MASREIFSLGALYVLLFGALGAEVSFLPYLLTTEGVSAARLGLTLAIGTIVQVIVAPGLGLLADRIGIRLVLGLSAGAAAASFLLFYAPVGAGYALFVYAIFAATIAPLNPLADALSVPACLRAGIPYGFVRGVGSAGFFVGVLLSTGITSRFGVSGIVPMTAVLLGLVALTVANLGSVRLSPKTAATPSRPATRSLRELFANSGYRRVLLVAALVIGSHAMSDAFAVVYWTAIGMSTRIVGLLLAVAVCSEFVAFVVAGPLLLARFGPSTCAAIGAGAGVVRWALLAETHSVWPLLAAQLMHGLTFSLVHLALMQVLAIVAPRHLFATAQSLYGICGNALASSAITLVAGSMFAGLQAHTFWLPAVLCGVAFPVALRLRHIAPQWPSRSNVTHAT